MERFATQENTYDSSHRDVIHLDDSSAYTLYEKSLNDRFSICNTIKPMVACLTEVSTAQDSRLLCLHRGLDNSVACWKLGTEIKYSIDYNSFMVRGHSKQDADYALQSLVAALDLWNYHNIGVKLVFVGPDTNPIVFKLMALLFTPLYART